ncbi:hypothetical protein NXF25_020203 [Crotalus adamanteus]|uniref:Uncharacterized protein n=1 Tax=Crotalus adamanteus TaxID=8729 RepID=A0AAW1B457_CROAD
MEHKLGRESKNEIVQAENITPTGPDEQPDNNIVEVLNEQTEETIRLQGPNEQTEENENQGLDEPLSDSTTQKLTEQEEKNQPQELSELSEGSQLQDLSKQDEENQLQELTEQGEENQLQDLTEQGKESQPQDLTEQGEESQFQDLTEQGEESQFQDLTKQGEESRFQDMTEQGEESQFQGQSQQGEEKQPEELSETAEENQLQELSEPDEESKPSDISELDESSKVQDLTEQVKDNEPQDFTYLAVEPIRMQEQTILYDQPAPPSFIDYLATSITGRQDEQGRSAAPESILDITQLERKDSKIQDIKKIERKVTISIPSQWFPELPCLKHLIKQFRKPPPPKVTTPKTSPQTKDKDTQITTSFETLLKRPLVSVEKKKKEKNKPVPKGPSKQASPSKTRPSPSRRKSVSSSGSHVSRSMPTKKSKKPNVIYNVHITVYDRGRDINTQFIKDTAWEDCIVCSGLSRICTVFNVLKCGRVPVSKLLFVLHTLKILVTRDEMYCALQLMNVDVLGTLNFSDFLEVVNKTSPFAQTEGFQNILWAFRKIKKDMVCIDDLRLILENLEVNLTCETIHDALKCTRINKNRLLNFKEFILAVRELQKHPAEEVFPSEYALLERKPFQDVTGLVGADSRWRRKYQSYFDSETSESTTPYFSGLTSSSTYSDFDEVHRKVSCPFEQSILKDEQADEDHKITIVKILQSDTADQKVPGTASSVDHEESNAKESDNVEAKKSVTDVPVIESTSAEPEPDLTEEKKDISDTPDQNIPPVDNAEDKDKEQDIVEEKS